MSIGNDPILYILQIHVEGGGTHSWPIIRNHLSLGRDSCNHIILQGRTVSRQHIWLCRRDRIVQVMDCNSTNGTFLNGHRLPPQRLYMLTPRDQMRVDRFLLSVRLSCKQDQIPPDMGCKVRLVAPPNPGLIINLPRGEYKLPLEGKKITLGRARDNDVVLLFPGIAAHHAELQCLGSDCLILDLSGSGGLCFGNQCISQMLLEDGVTILMGEQISLQYRTDIGFVPVKSLPYEEIEPPGA